MNHNLEREGTDKGTAELNPYYRYGTYVPSKLVGSRSYWASRHLDLTAMSRELGKGDLFITLTMNDNWADLQAAVQKGCRAGAVWPREYPKNTGPNKPIQDCHDMEACEASVDDMWGIGYILLAISGSPTPQSGGEKQAWHTREWVDYITLAILGGGGSPPL